MVGVDPGLVGTGFAVVEGAGASLEIVGSGVIETPAAFPLEERVRVIYEGIGEVLDAQAPAALVLEDLYSEYRFPRTALLMAHARGVICLAARQRAIPVLALAPSEVKRAVTANGAASKAQVQSAVQRLLGLGVPPRPSHVADALALAWTGLSRLDTRAPAGVHPQRPRSRRPSAVRLRT